MAVVLARCPFTTTNPGTAADVEDGCTGADAERLV